jgi:hypothetical protein
LPWAIGAHHPIGQPPLLIVDLLGQLADRRQARCPLEQRIGLRFMGLALDRQQALGVGEQDDRIVRCHRRCGSQMGQELPQPLECTYLMYKL